MQSSSNTVPPRRDSHCRPCTPIIPLQTDFLECTTHYPIPNSNHLILVGGLLISHWFSWSLGWPSPEVTTFSQNCFLVPYLLHSARICQFHLVLWLQHQLYQKVYSQITHVTSGFNYFSFNCWARLLILTILDTCKYTDYDFLREWSN